MTLKEFAKKIIASINPGTADISGIGDGTIKGAISELNKNLIKYLDITYILPNLTWKKSAYGMYYCDDIVVENVSLILGINIIGFNGIRATDVIIPIISSDGSKVRFISNVNSFAGNETNIKVRIIYK